MGELYSTLGPRRGRGHLVLENLKTLRVGLLLTSVLLLTESKKQSNSKTRCVCTHCSVMKCITLFFNFLLIYFTVGVYAVASIPSVPLPFPCVFRTFEMAAPWAINWGWGNGIPYVPLHFNHWVKSFESK